jgi:hypothetical protein
VPPAGSHNISVLIGLQLGVAGDGYAHERDIVMLRNLGISLLLLGLFGATVDGFRVRDRVRTSPGTSVTTGTEDDGRVHSAEGACIPPN